MENKKTQEGNYEQLESNVKSILGRSQVMPDSVKAIVKRMFDQLKENYKSKGVYGSEIKNYIDGKFMELNAELENGLGNERKAQQMERVQHFLNDVRVEVEEMADIDQDDREKRKIEDTLNNRHDNVVVTLSTIEQVGGAFQNIQTMFRKMLDNTGLYSEKQIDALDDEIKGFISKLIGNNENTILEAFENDGNSLANEIVQAFEEYRGNGNAKRSPQEAFRNKLSIREGGGFETAIGNSEQGELLINTLPSSVLDVDVDEKPQKPQKPQEYSEEEKPASFVLPDIELE